MQGTFYLRGARGALLSRLLLNSSAFLENLDDASWFLSQALVSLFQSAEPMNCHQHSALGERNNLDVLQGGTAQITVTSVGRRLRER
ncbi:hypothetical protein PUNSTDRAFT_113634 [Punctularia strigosozonata HHB-11173 SS5]|uniref:uncharacterized protein n=1 Tax=Punctularia strigosozonata (strain HHB-11173) TaxID=741275 RepID=UPI0004416252|nr:uncharacterized protein PUNSTDRAFT_113634 [Punctularia strigosozonata HHB-11173 SS5]EIN09115.1 hypothetical protein PUNSTDRAFT_113634 [Punctularia strigosozonata HHB-11173 SS5]